jgi:hypothetical protein
MRKRIACCFALVVAVALLALPGLTRQQDKSKRPSPPAKAVCSLPDGKTITTDYSSPRLKGRKIIGGQDPYGKPWRAGANEATTFVTTADLTVDGKPVPAGSYTIFAIPYADKPWTLIISKKTGEWGIPYPGEQNDLLRADMQVSALPSQLENFTIGYDKTDGGCTLHMDWDMTRASIAVTEKK